MFVLYFVWIAIGFLYCLLITSKVYNSYLYHSPMFLISQVIHIRDQSVVLFYAIYFVRARSVVTHTDLFLKNAQSVTRLKFLNSIHQADRCKCITIYWKEAKNERRNPSEKKNV